MIIRALHYNECQAYGLRLQDVDEGRPENKFVGYILDSIDMVSFVQKLNYQQILSNKSYITMTSTD